MDGHVFVINGDLTQLTADAIGYSTSTALRGDGHLHPAFAKQVQGFRDRYAQLPRPCQLGDAFWLPLAADRPPYGVVVVAAAGGGPGLSRPDKARLAVQSALGTAIAALRRSRPEPQRLLVALPTFRLGMGGDRNQRLESAQVQLRAAREVLELHPQVDVAFVAYPADNYRILLQARRDLGLAPAPPEPSRLDGLLAAVRQGRCVLFVGAGISAGAGLPRWKELIDQLAAELGIPAGGRDDLDYFLDLAQWYVNRHGPANLTRRLAAMFGGDRGKPTLAHYLLMALPIRLAITTNYDNLLERTLTALRRYPVTVIEEKDVVLTGQADGVCVVKLHGDAHQGGIVLCRDDYDGFFRKRPAMALLLEGLLLNQTFLFAGYGLKDPNFRQIYSRIADMLEGARREAFALSVDEESVTGGLLAEQWRKKGLHLLSMPGADRDRRVRALLLFLDWLADQVTLQEQDLFLARDVPGRPSLQGLRRTLIEEVGRELLSACRHGPPEDAPQLAQVLALLTDHGWRPDPRSGFTLPRLWAKLADDCPEVAARRRMLIRALRHAENFDDAEDLQRRLEDLGPLTG